jgi:hypothetical protein
MDLRTERGKLNTNTRGLGHNGRGSSSASLTLYIVMLSNLIYSFCDTYICTPEQYLSTRSWDCHMCVGHPADDLRHDIPRRTVLVSARCE